jgi:hypothetical protein
VVEGEIEQVTARMRTAAMADELRGPGLRKTVIETKFRGTLCVGFLNRKVKVNEFTAPTDMQDMRKILVAEMD